MNDILVACFAHNRWANLLLADACLAADPAVLGEGLHGAFGSIRETMQHIAIAEASYAAALAGGDPERSSPIRGRAASMTEIRDELARTGDLLTAAARAASPGASLSVDWDGDGILRPMPSDFLLVQALDHGREHRTQVAAILTRNGVTPPDMDAWSFYGV
ncbi:MAG: DinB family protein [Chloroflexota bacterium]